MSPINLVRAMSLIILHGPTRQYHIQEETRTLSMMKLLVRRSAIMRIEQMRRGGEEEKRFPIQNSVSSEMMRKEQQNALQEKQKLNLEKHKSSDVSDLFEVLEDKNEEKGTFVRHDELEASASTPTLSSVIDKLSFASHSIASRPLSPPGFKNNLLERRSGLKCPVHHPLLEHPTSVLEVILPRLPETR